MHYNVVLVKLILVKGRWTTPIIFWAPSPISVYMSFLKSLHQNIKTCYILKLKVNFLTCQWANIFKLSIQCKISEIYCWFYSIKHFLTDTLTVWSIPHMRHWGRICVLYGWRICVTEDAYASSKIFEKKFKLKFLHDFPGVQLC